MIEHRGGARDTTVRGPAPPRSDPVANHIEAVQAMLTFFDEDARGTPPILPPDRGAQAALGAGGSGPRRTWPRLPWRRGGVRAADGQVGDLPVPARRAEPDRDVRSQDDRPGRDPQRHRRGRTRRCPASPSAAPSRSWRRWPTSSPSSARYVTGDGNHDIKPVVGQRHASAPTSARSTPASPGATIPTTGMPTNVAAVPARRRCRRRSRARRASASSTSTGTLGAAYAPFDPRRRRRRCRRTCS